MRDPNWKKELEGFLSEDRASRDITSLAVIPKGHRARAYLVTQKRGIVSGLVPASLLARHMGLTVRLEVHDGARVISGQKVLTLAGNARSILAVERTLVNLVMHLSGISTETGRTVGLARSVNPNFRIAATRKTLPGLRDMEKLAVRHGGGDPHRRDLSSAILVKGNHIALVGFESALKSALEYGRRHRLEVMMEVANVREAALAAQAGATRLLVDNLSPSKVKRVISRLCEMGLRERVIVEATGGITTRNVRAYALSGADIASSGHLTHSSAALPMHLVMERIPSRAGRA